jgi:hypothetical protein
MAGTPRSARSRRGSRVRGLALDATPQQAFESCAVGSSVADLLSPEQKQRFQSLFDTNIDTNKFQQPSLDQKLSANARLLPALHALDGIPDPLAAD